MSKAFLLAGTGLHDAQQNRCLSATLPVSVFTHDAQQQSVATCMRPGLLIIQVHSLKLDHPTGVYWLMQAQVLVARLSWTSRVCGTHVLFQELLGMQSSPMILPWGPSSRMGEPYQLSK